MQEVISDLVTRFERGTLSRRQLIGALAMLAAGESAHAQEIGRAHV